MSADKEKIILKTDRLEGVDKSIYDYTQIHTVPIVVTKITKSMYKKGKSTFIGLQERVIEGEVIKVNASQITYRIMKAVKLDPHYGAIYKLLRTDGSNIVQLDLDAAMKGNKVKILRVKDNFFKKCRNCKNCTKCKCN